MSVTTPSFSHGDSAPHARLGVVVPGVGPDCIRVPLHVTVRAGTDSDGAALVIVTGDIDAANAAKVRATMSEIVTRRRYVVVDLDDARFLDATLLPELVDATCSEVGANVTMIFTSDPRSMLMLKVADTDL